MGWWRLSPQKRGANLGHPAKVGHRQEESLISGRPAELKMPEAQLPKRARVRADRILWHRERYANQLRTTTKMHGSTLSESFVISENRRAIVIPGRKRIKEGSSLSGRGRDADRRSKTASEGARATSSNSRGNTKASVARPPRTRRPGPRHATARATATTDRCAV